MSPSPDDDPVDRSRSPLDRLRGLSASAPGAEHAAPTSDSDQASVAEPDALPPEPEAPAPSVIAVGERPDPYRGETARGTTVPPDEETGRKKKPQGSFLKELPILLGIAIVLALLIKTFLVQAFFIPSASMLQTLHVHDRVLVNKVTFHVGDPKPGEIIVFNTSGTRFAEAGGDYAPCPNSNALVSGVRSVERFIGVGTCGEDDFIKRIIAVPGDRIQCCDQRGHVVLNGVSLSESYVYDDNKSAFCAASLAAVEGGGSYDPAACGSDPKPIVVPKNMYWVMGDNRGNSSDSRPNGFVPRNKIVGRAFVRILPVSRIGFLRIPKTFSSVPAAAAGVGALPIVSAPALFLPLVGGRALRRRRRSRRSV
ncbi:MAG TPA: signal peptidase I [Mycobacteriales bacterium]